MTGTPRVRDLPAPRRAQGMIAPIMGRVFAWPYRIGLAGLHRAGFRPWHLTVLSLVGNVAAGWLLLTGRRFVPAMVLIAAGLLDIERRLARTGRAAERSAAVHMHLGDPVGFHG